MVEVLFNTFVWVNCFVTSVYFRSGREASIKFNCIDASVYFFTFRLQYKQLRVPSPCKAYTAVGEVIPA